MQFNLPIPPLQIIAEHPGKAAGISLYIKRDDLLHPEIQGNKWRKLAPVIAEVRASYPGGIVTFGGPYSNHLHAVAAAGRVFGFPSVGIVRGRHVDSGNPTLLAAQNNGMTLYPVSRQVYDACKQGGGDWLAREFPGAYILPEGGSTRAAVENCAAITREISAHLQQNQPVTTPLRICVPAGTGCTAAGVVAGLENKNGHVVIFPVVNNGFDERTILGLLSHALPGHSEEAKGRFRITGDYEFGGFAKPRQPVLDFARSFLRETGILLDPVYTSKMMFGVYDMLVKGDFPPDSTVVALHTGGLQGWDGFKERWGITPDSGSAF